MQLNLPAANPDANLSYTVPICEDLTGILPSPSLFDIVGLNPEPYVLRKVFAAHEFHQLAQENRLFSVDTL